MHDQQTQYACWLKKIYAMPGNKSIVRPHSKHPQRCLLTCTSSRPARQRSDGHALPVCTIFPVHEPLCICDKRLYSPQTFTRPQLQAP